MQNAARLARSPRLQRTLAALRDAGGEISSLELALKTHSPAIGTNISELRANGVDISCRQAVEDGQRRFYYTLNSEPKD